MFEKFITAWTTPAGAMVILGGIVWGVQLNVMIIGIKSRLSSMGAEQDKQASELLEVTRNNLRTCMILKQLEKNAERALKKADQAAEEQAEIKERVIKLEAKQNA